MAGRRNKKWIVGAILFALFFQWIPEGYSEDRKMAALGPPPFPMPQRPADFHDSDELYVEYFSAQDTKIQNTYLDQWRYHDWRVSSSSGWQGEHFTPQNMAFDGQFRLESDVRSDFAQQVFRMRVDTAVRKYFDDRDRARSFRRASQTLNQIKNYQVAVSDDKSQGQFRVGYDVFTDNSKLEYSRSGLDAGVYYPHLLSALTGNIRPDDALTIRVTAHPGGLLPDASLGYRLNGTALESGLRKGLTRSVSTEMTEIHPTSQNNGLQESCMLRLLYNF